MHGRFDRFSDVQGAPSLRIRVGQRGQHASKSRTSRIRRRSGQHLTDVSALGGPMMDRLYRWLTSMVIDCTRRGMHDQADANGPCRGCATAVSCRAASRTSRRACPCPVLLCTLHIGGANLKSSATCDSTLLPRSPTDVPAPSGQRRCRVHPNHGHKLQADAIWGLLTSFRSVVTHSRATGGGVPDVSLLLPAGRVHPICLA